MDGRALFSAVVAGWICMALLAGMGAGAELFLPGAHRFLTDATPIMSWTAVAAAGGACAVTARASRLVHASLGGVAFTLAVVLVGPLVSGQPVHASVAQLTAALLAGALGGIVTLLVT